MLAVITDLPVKETVAGISGGSRCVKFSHNNCAAEAHNNCEGFTTQPGHPE